MTITNIDICK